MKLTVKKRHYSKRHDYEGHHEIRHSQAHEKIIRHVLQVFVHANGEADQNVSAGRHEHQHKGQQSPPIVLERLAVRWINATAVGNIINITIDEAKICRNAVAKDEAREIREFDDRGGSGGGDEWRGRRFTSVIFEEFEIFQLRSFGCTEDVDVVYVGCLVKVAQLRRHTGVTPLPPAHRTVPSAVFLTRRFTSRLSRTYALHKPLTEFTMSSPSTFP